MYAVGETFYHEIFEEEYELHVIGDLMSGGKEYIIAEDSTLYLTLTLR